jgi:hypothetical protein
LNSVSFYQELPFVEGVDWEASGTGAVKIYDDYFKLTVT